MEPNKVEQQESFPLRRKRILILISSVTRPDRVKTQLALKKASTTTFNKGTQREPALMLVWSYTVS